MLKLNYAKNKKKDTIKMLSFNRLTLTDCVKNKNRAGKLFLFSCFFFNVKAIQYRLSIFHSRHHRFIAPILIFY